MDIMAVEKESSLSESELEEELCFLPAVPSPDVEEEIQEKCRGSSTKAGESAQSMSPLSVEAAQNENPEANLLASSPMEGERRSDGQLKEMNGWMDD